MHDTKRQQLLGGLTRTFSRLRPEAFASIDACATVLPAALHAAQIELKRVGCDSISVTVTGNPHQTNFSELADLASEAFRNRSNSAEVSLSRIWSWKGVFALMLDNRAGTRRVRQGRKGEIIEVQVAV